MDAFLKLLKKVGPPVLAAAVGAGLQAAGAPAWAYEAVASFFSFLF